jgi:hypothetical protein
MDTKATFHPRRICARLALLCAKTRGFPYSSFPGFFTRELADLAPYEPRISPKTFGINFQTNKRVYCVSNNLCKPGEEISCKIPEKETNFLTELFIAGDVSEPRHNILLHYPLIQPNNKTSFLNPSNIIMENCCLLHRNF